jgi:hypothetical protein
MLSPSVRSIYTSALMPPPGMAFAEAIATTFSMDPSLLLQAPVYLALMAEDGAKTQTDTLRVLEAIRRHSGMITAYVQRARIIVPSHATTLFSLLEPMTVEVIAPKGGVFHPKLWLIRFVSANGADHVIRLVVLSRNLTADRSWDLSLQLEGSVAGRPRSENRALAELISRLPSWATRPVDEERTAQAARMAEDVRRVDWELPDGFDEYAASFYVPGIEGFEWKPAPSKRLAIISPFCGSTALERLASDTDEPFALISRADTLAELDPSVLGEFQNCMCLDQSAETDDGEDASRDVATDMLGLHAKVYLFERRYYKDYTHLIMGSANATNAALVAQNNIELLVELVGRTDKVGGVADLIGQDGLGEYLVPYAPEDEQPLDSERRSAEQCMESARESLAMAGFRVACSQGETENQYRVSLTGAVPDLAGIRACKAWPITLGVDHGVLLTVGEENTVLAAGIASASVTGLIAFELVTTHPEVSCRFVLSLPIDGVPEDRDAAVLQTIVSNEEGFLRYLLLLLGDDGMGFVGHSEKGGEFSKWLEALGSGDDIPILEELARAFCRTPARLQEVNRLIQDLTAKSTGDQVVPASFLALWSVFERALEDGHER